jgi:hypothetical protein
MDLGQMLRHNDKKILVLLGVATILLFIPCGS